MHLKIKVCGLTDERDAEVAAEAGADILGVILARESVRFVPPSRARSIAAAARDTRCDVRIAAVFVNSPIEEVIDVLDRCSIDWAQLHGDEPPEWVQPGGMLFRRGYRVVRPSAQGQVVVDRRRWICASRADDMPDVLVDAYHPGARGGTGRLADWSSAAEMARGVKVLLAGGLTPGNVSAAVRVVRPWGVDVSSGVERAPGRKDPEAVRVFVAAAREAHRSYNEGVHNG